MRSTEKQFKCIWTVFTELQVPGAGFKVMLLFQWRISPLWPISSDHTGLELTQCGDPNIIPAPWYSGETPWVVAAEGRFLHTIWVYTGHSHILLPNPVMKTQYRDAD